MKKVGTLSFKFMHMAAVVIALLLLPLPSVAQGIGIDASGGQNNSAGNIQDSTSPAREFDCTTLATGQHFHCHLASPHPQATGPVRPLDGDQPALAAHPAALPAQEVAAQIPAASTHIPITASARFILFGNFRS